MVEDHLNWKVIFKKILLPTGENEETIDNNDSAKQLDTSGERLNGLAISSFERNKAVVNDAKSVTNELNGKKEIPFWNPIEQTSVTKKNNGNLCVKNVFESNDIPDWNTVFKRILGEKMLPTECNSSQNEVKSIETNMNVTPQKRPFLREKKKPIYKSKKVIEEEERINELFALSRTFKVQSSTYNLNDFDGAGINIFKTDSERSSKEHLFDSYSSLGLNDASTDDFVPLKGKVAALAQARINPSPSPDIKEFWDDELWY